MSSQLAFGFADAFGKTLNLAEVRRIESEYDVGLSQPGFPDNNSLCLIGARLGHFSGLFLYSPFPMYAHQIADYTPQRLPVDDNVNQCYGNGGHCHPEMNIAPFAFGQVEKQGLLP